jgi:flagellar M-ring protein FliF
VPGALTNQPAAAPTAPIGSNTSQPAGAAASSSGGPTDSHKESIVNYEVDKTTRVLRGATGMVKRLSAAVVVNSRTSKDPDGNVTTTPLSEQEVAQINALVREAMGFSKDRGDSLNVSNVPFSMPEKMEAVDIPMWKDPSMLSTAAEFGKWAALVLAALIVVRGFIKPALETMKGPTPSPQAESASTPRLSTTVGPDAAEIAALPSPGAASIDQARELARSDPRAVANVVKNWVAKE